MGSGRDHVGHGHVRPNPDGSKARCGGPAICSVCALELAAQSELPEPVDASDFDPPVWRDDDGDHVSVEGLPG